MGFLFFDDSEHNKKGFSLGCSYIPRENHVQPSIRLFKTAACSLELTSLSRVHT